MPKIFFLGKERFYLSVPPWNGGSLSCLPTKREEVRFPRHTLEQGFQLGVPHEYDYSHIVGMFVHLLNLLEAFGGEAALDEFKGH